MELTNLFAKINPVKNQFKLLTIFYFLFILSVSSGCDNVDGITDSGCNTNNNTIHGSGNPVTIVRELPEFHSINHTTVGLVSLTCADTQKVSVTVDDNIYQYVKMEVVNGELVISIVSPEGLSDFDLKFDISVPEIRMLTTGSAGQIEGKNKFYADKVFFNLYSAGSINMEIEAEEVHSTLFSAGNLFIKGSAGVHFANLYSAGNLNAFSLDTDTTFIVLNSAGNGYVKVSNYLDATLVSAGSVYYLGYPQIVRRIYSIGRVYNAN